MSSDIDMEMQLVENEERLQLGEDEQRRAQDRRARRRNRRRVFTYVESWLIPDALCTIGMTTIFVVFFIVMYLASRRNPVEY